MKYSKFLKTKKSVSQISGFDIENEDINKNLFDFQKEIVTWAIKKGKSAIFADCGMGKTIMQLEWANQICKKTSSPVLILAPLAVSKQTISEGEKFGIEVLKYDEEVKIQNKIYITNYEKLHRVEHEFGGIVLDESSILKSFMGKFRNLIIERFSNTKYKLACSATPSPNDYTEIGNHCDFLNVCTMQEMLSMYFINDISGKCGEKGWRLKGHAENNFWEFVGSWSVMIKKPSDIGFDDTNYNLPELNIQNEILSIEKKPDTTLFHIPADTLSERRESRKESLEERVSKTMEIIKQNPNEQFLIWCDFNNESELLSKSIEGAVEIKGSDKPEHKESSMMGFSSGDIKILVTKPSIAGFGMNWQNCNNMIFCGLSDSYEKFYQATRRCWRFGQKKDVNVHIIISEKEIKILENIKRKERDFKKMSDSITSNVSKVFNNNNFKMNYKTTKQSGSDWNAWLGDSVELVKELADNSIDYSIYSPPFASLYTYSNSERDMGNCKNTTEFYDHFIFLAKDIFRVMKPGRNMSFHCMNLPTSKFRDGFIGINDFRGDLIKIFQDAGFIFHSEVCIWKDPVVAMQRTKALGLLHKQIKKDSSMSRQGIPDYLVTMRKPGENKEPIVHTPEQFPVDEWQKIASPVWMDIRQSNTLQKKSARADKDEKHICPLQLDVIERALYLWSNPDDLVFSPFMGIGSEGYVSLKLGRKFIGFELKESYYNQAIKNLEAATKIKKQQHLF